MDQEELEDYESRERHEFDRYLEELHRGRAVTYPANRFNKLAFPVARRANQCSLWAQIPLYGSLIIPIFPVDKTDFRQIHGFEWNDFPKLVDFWKDTGRIQFVLGGSPLLYRGLDYLDAILKERPPVVWANFPHENFDPKVLTKWRLEFQTAARTAFLPDFLDTFEGGGFRTDAAYSRLHELELAYVWLRANGYDHVAEQIIESMVVEPEKAHAILYFYRATLVLPSIQSMPMITNMSYEDLREFRTIGGALIPTRDVLFPAEIGAFLLRKVTPIPEGFES